MLSHMPISTTPIKICFRRPMILSSISQSDSDSYTPGIRGVSRYPIKRINQDPLPLFATSYNLRHIDIFR